MTGIRRPQHDSAAIRQSVIEAVRRLESGQGGLPDADAFSDFRQLTDALPLSVFVWLGIKVVYVNRAACRLAAATSPGDLLARRATDLMQPEDRDALSRLLLKGADPASGAESQRFTLRRLDGSKLPVRAQLVTMDWQGHPAVLAIITEAEARNGANGTVERPSIAADPPTDAEFVDPPGKGDAYGLNGAPSGERRGFPGFEQVQNTVADMVLALPPVESDGAIIIDATASLLEWVPEPVIGALNQPAAPQATTDRPTELDEAQRLSEAALAAATNGIVIIDALVEGRPIIYVNAAFERMTGFSFDETVGCEIATVLGNGGADHKGIERISLAIAERRPETALVHARRKDGSAYWSEIHVVPARDGGGRVTHVVVIQDEMTGRVTDNERCREAEARLRAFAETAAEWFWEFDADLRYAYVSDRYFELTGDDPPDVLGKTIYEFQKGVPTHELDRLFATLGTASPFSHHVFSRTTRDGRTVWFSADGVPITDDEGAFVGYRGSARDITAELAAQRALGEAEARHHRLTAGLPAMTYQRVQGADGAVFIPYVSDAAREIFGAEPAEIIDDPGLLDRRIALEDRSEVARQFNESIRSMEAFSIEYRIADRDGRRKWLLTQARPRRSEGRGVTWDCVTVDITASRDKTAAMEAARDFYRAVLDSVPAPVCCIDQEGRLTHANTAFSGLFAGSVANRTLDDLLPARTAQKVMDAAATVFASETTAEEEVVLDDDGGPGRAFRIALVPLRAAGNAVTLVQASWTETTGMRAAERARRDSERRFHTALNAVPVVGLAYVDGDERIQLENPAHRALFSGPDDAADGRTLWDALGEAAYGRIRRHVAAALAGEIVTFEWTRDAQQPHGSIETTFTPHRGDDGSVQGFFASFADLTERRQSRAAIEDRDRRLAHLADKLPGIVFQRIADPAGNASFPYVSCGVRDLLGITADQVTGDASRLERTMHVDDRAAVREAFETSRMNLAPLDLEVRHALRSGAAVLLRYLAQPRRRDTDGTVVWDGLMLDLTAERTAEFELHDIETRYRALLDLAPDAIMVHDGERITHANPAAATLHGVNSAEELVDRPWREILQGPDGSGQADTLGRVSGGDSASPFTASLWASASGRRISVEARAKPVTWKGRPAALVVVRDRTEIDRLAGALTESEARLSALIDLSPDAIYVSVEGRIAYANGAACRLFEADSADQLIGTDPIEFAAVEDRNDIVRRRSLVDAGERVSWAERRRGLADGRSIHYETMAFPIEWKGTRSRLVICRDITRRKELEQALAAAETASRETAEAADAARQEAEAARNAKQRFISGISHEIRTPLNGMLGMAGLLIDSRLAEDQRHHAETIRQSGKAVLNVLNDMIELAKLKDGNAPLEMTNFEIRSVAEGVIEILAPSAFAKGIDLGAYVAPNVPEWVAGDAGRTRQVLFNMIGNAIKRTEHGGVTVKINLDEQKAGRLVLFVRVANTGGVLPTGNPGQPFGSTAGGRQVLHRHGPETSPFDLDICREIVRLMNGETGEENDPERGSVIWIRIELDQVHPAPRAKIAPCIAALNGRRALLAGGNPVTRQLLGKQLRAFGMSVGSVATGEDALSAIADAAGREAPYDLALVDLALPDMEATEFSQRVRDLSRHRDVRLMLSAPTGRNVSRSRAKELGFEAVLRKPIRQETLVRRTAALFGVDPETGWTPARAAPLNVTGRSLRILVAEDNPASQQIVAHMLINAGHRVDVANNGVEAVNAIRNVPYDLALMDIRMPEMDGVTATKLVRAFADGGAAIPIIAMIAGDDGGPRNRIIDAGTNAVIEKPVDVVQLERAIEEVCLPEDEDTAVALPREPRQVPPITATEREELKTLLASLDGIVEARR